MCDLTAAWFCTGYRLLATDSEQFAVQHQPDAGELVEHHEHADAEIDVVCGLGCGCSREGQAAFAQQSYEDALMMHDEIGDRAMESEQEDSEQQPCHFHEHVLDGKCRRHIAQSGEKPSWRGFSLFTDCITELLESRGLGPKITNFTVVH